MVYLIDASVYVFRAWHSLPPEIADRDGNPTQALYGFARFLSDLLERRQPRHVAVAFDESHGSCFRHKLYPPYKANREAAPDALKRQFALCREFCRAPRSGRNSPAMHYEADDLIGTLAQRCRADGLPVTVVSRDKDLAQLIGPGDVFWDYGDAAEYRYEQIAARFGVPPERMADYLALRGDSVDNVPGVPGVGPKTAAALMRLFAIARGDVRRPRCRRRSAAAWRGDDCRQRLRLHREAAYLARSLTRIVCDAPIDAARPRLAAADLQRRAPDLQRVAAFCDEPWLRQPAAPSGRAPGGATHSL